MKRIVTIIACVFAFSFAAEAQFKFGAHAQLLTGGGGSFGVGARGHYQINDDFAGQASFTYYLEDYTAWALDLDVHYSGFDLGDVESFSLTPFAGLNIYNVSVDTGLPGFDFGLSSTNINVGINGTMPLSGRLSLFVEPKLVLGSGSGFVLTAGVYF